MVYTVTLKNNNYFQPVCFTRCRISSFSTFDPKKVPASDFSDLHSYGEDSVDLLINHYGADLPAETVQGDEYIKQALISPELRTKWKTFRRYLSQQPKGP